MSISDEELRALMKKKFATLMTAFKSFDKNGDGQVNRKEFGVGLKHVGVDLPPAIVDRIWKMADTDGTGALAYQEFARKFAAYKVKMKASLYKIKYLHLQMMLSNLQSSTCTSTSTA